MIYLNSHVGLYRSTNYKNIHFSPPSTTNGDRFIFY